MNAETSRCAVHTDVPAIGTCARCGNFMCSNCVHTMGVRQWCTTCFKRLPTTRAEPTHPLAVVALLFSFVGVAPLFGMLLVRSVLLTVALLCICGGLLYRIVRSPRFLALNATTRQAFRVSLFISIGWLVVVFAMYLLRDVQLMEPHQLP